MMHTKRLWSGWIHWLSRCAGALLIGGVLAGCTSEEAEKARVATATIRAAHSNAVSSYVTLYLRGKGIADRPLEQRVSELAQYELVRAADSSASVETDGVRQARLRKELLDEPLSVRMQKDAQTELAEVIQIMDTLEQAANDYAVAWPFGTEQFVCLKDSATALAAGMKKSTLRFNRPDKLPAPGNLYVALQAELHVATRQLDKAIAGKDLAATIEKTSNLRKLYLEEIEANAKVQASFALAAQSANDLGKAIDGLSTVTLGEFLGLIAKLVPALAALNSQADADRVAQQLQITLGKVNGNTWLAHLADKPIGPPITCKQP